MSVGFTKACRLARFLRKRLDHPNTGDGVGQYVGDFRPDPVNFFEAGAQAVAHHMNGPGDERQRHQRDQRQPWVDGKQDGCGHHDHQHISGEIEQVQRQEHADAVGLRTNPRHQVAGALGTKIFQRQAQQVLVGNGAQVGTDTLGYFGQNIGARPAQRPRQQRRAKQAAEQLHHQAGVDRLAVLVRDQHLVHQRHGQVGRHQRGGSRGQREQKSRQQLQPIRVGKAPQPEQHPGRRRRDGLAAA